MPKSGQRGKRRQKRELGQQRKEHGKTVNRGKREKERNQNERAPATATFAPVRCLVSLSVMTMVHGWQSAYRALPADSQSLVCDGLRAGWAGSLGSAGGRRSKRLVAEVHGMAGASKSDARKGKERLAPRSDNSLLCILDEQRTKKTTRRDAAKGKGCRSETPPRDDTCII